jgi:iron complex outermembrane recepter protein
LLQNTNSGIASAPRWNMVAPEEIERVDVMYGPYSAQYPGNSMGAVVKYTTRMPEKLTATAKNITEVQDYSQFGTTRGYTNNITQIFIGDKVNDFMWNVSGNWQHGSQQPLTFVTSNVTNMTGAQYAAYPGAINTMSKFGQPTVMYGSAGNLAVDQVQGKAKLAYDISTTTRASYTFGYFSNDSSSSVQNYMFGNSGNYFFGTPSSNGNLASAKAPAAPLSSTLTTFGQGIYRIQEKLMTNAGSVKSNTGGLFDYELTASNFTYLQSNQSNPYSVAYPYGGVTEPGRVQKGGGTYWTDVDANGILRPDGALKAHTVTFGMHGDQHHLNNPVYYNTQWTQGEQSSYGFAQTIAQGTTRTKALWAQDAIKINDATKFTVGIRGENWIASNGYNQASNTSSIGANGLPVTGLSAANSKAYALNALPTYQPTLYHTRFSPKGSLEYLIDDKWKVIGNIGMANRFPTVGELYNLSAAAGQTNNTVPNPYLSPEVALTKEINFERSLGEGQTAG